MATQARAGVRGLRERALESMGGPGQARIVLLLAAVLGLSGADAASLSATVRNIEGAFHVGDAEVGLLFSAVSLVGAVFTIPAGIGIDRSKRTRLLAASVMTWAVAAAVSGTASSYLWLLLARVGLGAATAVTGPAIASLTGDCFSPGVRGRVYGLILGGDLAGTGAGFLVAGSLSSVLSWRFAFWWPVLPSLALAWLVWRLPEPERGGSSGSGAGHDEARGRPPTGAARPRPGLVLTSSPTDWPLWRAVRYVLRVRTNIVLIVASALGYFFFAGLRSFAIIFSTSHYGISKPLASTLVLVLGVGALAGVYAGGRGSDRLLRRGYGNARVLVPAVALLALPLLIAPALVVTSVAVALPLLTMGAFLLGVPNPPLDAARLDIIHPLLWGRAEAVRSLLRALGEAAAPPLFGYVSQSLPGANGIGLEYTFLLFLIPLMGAGLLALAGLRTYPRDVATARASIHALRKSAA